MADANAQPLSGSDETTEAPAKEAPKSKPKGKSKAKSTAKSGDNTRKFGSLTIYQR